MATGCLFHPLFQIEVQFRGMIILNCFQLLNNFS